MRIHYQPKAYIHPSKPGHPERPHRQMAAVAGLQLLAEGKLNWEAALPVDVADALIAHDPNYLKMITDADFSRTRAHLMDGGDTVLSETTLEAALTALGGARAATAQIMSGETSTAFVIARPPGHHATRNSAMGFCLLGTAAWAALDARARHGARVALLDIDLHHGNGSQNILWDEPDMLFASTHEKGNWPNTGHAEETGGMARVINIPLDPGSGSATMRDAWANIFEQVAEFGPDMIIVSAGFDAHADDPLSGLNWKIEDYSWLGKRLAELADEICHGRILSILEGGYDLQVVKHGIAAFAGELVQLDDPCASSGDVPDTNLAGWRAPHIGGYTNMPVPGKERFKVTKVNGRLWIEETATGQFLYTVPDFVKLLNRDSLVALADKANELDQLPIDLIIHLEAEAKRAAGYNPGRSDDFSS